MITDVWPPGSFAAYAVALTPVACSFVEKSVFNSVPPLNEPANLSLTPPAILAQVGLNAHRNDSPKNLTQVDLRKLELGRALAAEPRVLIADESMAGLSDTEVDEVLEVLFKLSADGISIVLIEHIMRAVVRFSQRIVVLVAGKKIADGDPREVMSHPEVERAYLGQ